MHGVLRELDGGSEQQEEQEDLPPGSPGNETRKVESEQSMADQMAGLVVPLERGRQLLARNQADEDRQQYDDHAERPPRAIQRHGTGVPMRSAPAGGENCTSESGTGTLRMPVRKSRRTVCPSLSLRTMRLSSPRVNASCASRKSASPVFGTTRTQSRPSRLPARDTVNSARTSPAPERRLAGVAVRTVAGFTETCSRSGS